MTRPLNWKTLSRTTVYKDSWVELEASACQLPDGRVISPFYVNRVNDFAVVVAVTEEGELIAERQYRHGIEEVIWELPAGAIEPGEDPEEAARRELLEETGYRAEELEFLFKMAPNASTLSNFAWCYLARKAVPEGGQKLDALEDLEIHKIPLKEAGEMLENGEFPQAVHTAALYKAFEKLKEV